MKTRVVVIGGGFAGLNFIRSIDDSRDFDVTLVDRNNYNFFPPLIYQVATGFLEPSSISHPFRKLFGNKRNVHFWLGEFQEVKPDENKVIISDKELDYDILVLATGTKTNYFGLDNVRKNAIPMKTLDDALNMRNLLLQRIEMATKTKDIKEKEDWVTMVIAGGGPTGVEVSGMFAEMRRSIIAKEYPELNDVHGKIYLVNGGDSLLAPMSEESQSYTYEALKNLGVKIKLNTRVTDFDGENVSLKDGSYIRSKNLIWATGVTAMKFPGIPEETYGPGNRLKVDACNKIENSSNIYALGDTCIMTSDKAFPEGHPQLAQVAKQQGEHLAKNLKKINKGKEPEDFVYNDKGIMAIIGRSKAVAEIPKPKMNLKGLPAWLIWSLIHLFALVNRHDRLRTFYNWTIAYFTRNQDLRMIIRPKDRI
ncbi:NAD(P)/FAD-dependent oxidoreductase [Salegentibacter chungangensis]|uniref:NADH:ubiquinone reductase (non-electrogenic) n=1 Tax=Salegentibacter chungangensis TaxID=1335724 RepID=A0ABW3NRW6_9FLAO